MNNETRFFDRKAHMIDFISFTEIMQNLLDDATLEIEEDYPVLSLYSSLHDCVYDENEIMNRIGDYLEVTIIACLVYKDLEVVYFIEDK
jgi:hypothetical protein